MVNIAIIIVNIDFNTICYSYDCSDCYFIRIYETQRPNNIGFVLDIHTMYIYIYIFEMAMDMYI